MNVGDKISVSGTDYEVVYVGGSKRVLIKYDGGLIVSAEQNPDGTWDLGGPSKVGSAEAAFIQQNMPARDTTEIDLVKDGDSDV